MQSKHLASRVTCALVPCAALSCLAYAARAAESSDGKEQSRTIEEVLVTAQKRTERLVDVPVSIAVIGSEEIARRGLTGMEDYLRDLPGANQIDQGPASNAIIIRGITTSPQFENFSSGTTTATYFGETPITGAGGLGAGGIDVRPVDITRIEVLRGPQGTTYGTASLGGAVRLIPAPPDLDRYGVDVNAYYSETSGQGSGNSMMQGVVNLPLIADKFGLRAVGYRYDDSGYFRNVAGSNATLLGVAQRNGVANVVAGHFQDDVGQMLSTGGRLAALWQATDRLDVTMNLLTQEIEQNGWPVANTGTYEQARFPVAPQARVRGQAGEVADTDIDLANLVIDYELSWGQLTSTFSYIDSGSATAATTLDTSPRSSTNGSSYKSRMGEVRLASQFQGRFQFLGGVFYENTDEDFAQTSDWLGGPGPNPFGTDPILHFEQTRELDHRAVFGEAHYDLTKRLRATVGARVFKYEKNETTLQDGGLVRLPIGAGVRSIFDTEETNESYKASLSFKPNDRSLIYASWAEGYRLGRATAGLPSTSCDIDADGIVDGTQTTIASTRVIDPDFLSNYELGAKFELLDRRITINAAAYHIDWDGLPIRERAPCGLTYTTNVGAADSDGVELSASFLVGESLRINVGGSYNDAELAKAAPALLAPEGAPLPGSPDVNASLAVQYDFQLKGYNAFVRADSMYVSDFHGDLQETPGTLAGDYTKIDARTGISMRNINIELFVRNLTDEDAYTWRGLTPGSAFFGYRLRPRTVGIQLGYTF